MALTIDTSLLGQNIASTTALAGEAEAKGYGGVWVAETAHDAFLQALQAANGTTGISVGTEIAIAFARTPMTLAYSGYDLARYSEGRFIMGLGSQVKAHIVRRFGMPWSEPAKRMRELILATRAIWHAWENEEPLDFRGDFYQHTLMTPFFSPPRHDFGPPPVFAGGVGALMTEAVGEAADGYFFHPFTTQRFVHEVTQPALSRGRAKAGKSGFDDFTVAGPVFVCCGRTEKEMAAAITGTKNQIAFYASTPAYKGVLDLHGWGDLQPQLAQLAREDRWSEMGGLIDDEILHTISAVGTPAEVGRQLDEDWGDVADRITLYINYPVDDELPLEIVDALRG
jgi:probable F420-dependent oxidoreductase